MAYVTRGQGIAAIVLGILKLIMGVIIIIIGFVLAGKANDARLTVYWGGFIYLVPGIIGIIAGATKNGCAMITYMVINIILFILVGVASIIIFIAVALYAEVIREATTYCVTTGPNECTCNYENNPLTLKVSCSAINTVTSALWGIALAYLFAGVILLASSILGCISSCCTSPPPQGFIYQEQPPANTVVVSSNAQMAPPPYGYNPPQLPGKAGAI